MPWVMLVIRGVVLCMLTALSLATPIAAVVSLLLVVGRGGAVPVVMRLMRRRRRGLRVLLVRWFCVAGIVVGVGVSSRLLSSFVYRYVQVPLVFQPSPVAPE